MAEPQKDRGRYITTGERIGGVVGWAFVISLVLHAFLTPFLHAQRTASEETEPPVTMQHMVKPKPPPTPPPPTPTPPPTPQPQKQVQQHQQPNPHPLKVNLTHIHSSGVGPAQPNYVPPKNASENGVVGGTGTASPAPVAPTPAGCPDPDREATLDAGAQPQYPESAQEENLGPVEVSIIVTVSPSGSLISASIGKSSNNSAIDQDALRVARASTYKPKLVNCQPVTGTYQYLVDYNPG